MGKRIHNFSDIYLYDIVTNTLSSSEGLEELSMDALNWRYDGRDGLTIEGAVLSDDEDVEPNVHHFEELTPNGDFTEHYVECICPFAVGDFVRIANYRIIKITAVYAERTDYEDGSVGVWVWVATTEDATSDELPEDEREDFFTQGDKVASVGFVRDDGDFELLATFNNNGEYMSDEAFYALVTKTMSAIAEQGEMDDLIALSLECANDIVELDE